MDDGFFPSFSLSPSLSITLQAFTHRFHFYLIAQIFGKNKTMDYLSQKCYTHPLLNGSQLKHESRMVMKIWMSVTEKCQVTGRQNVTQIRSLIERSVPVAPIPSSVCSMYAICTTSNVQ